MVGHSCFASGRDRFFMSDDLLTVSAAAEAPNRVLWDRVCCILTASVKFPGRRVAQMLQCVALSRMLSKVHIKQDQVIVAYINVRLRMCVCCLCAPIG